MEIFRLDAFSRGFLIHLIDHTYVAILCPAKSLSYL